MLTVVEHLISWLRLRFAGADRGASMVEYSLLLVLLALICIAAVGLLGHTASSSFDSTGSIISKANAG
jgi:Flp pilus assembly pilin Flp